MRRPLVGVAVVLCAGSAAGVCLELPSVRVGVLAFVALASGALQAHRGRSGMGASLVLLGLLAIGMLAGMDYRVHRVDVMARVGTDLVVDGVVVSDSQPARGRLCFTLATRPLGVVPVVVAGHLRRWPRFGDRYRVSGVLERDWRDEPVLQVRTPDGLVRSGRGPLSWVAQGYRWRHAVARQLVAGVDGPASAEGALQAMVLGYRERIDPATRAAFSATGTSHVFALSGLHVAYLCAVVYFLVTCLGVPRRWWWVVLLPLVSMYVVVTGGRASAVRAGIMVMVMALAPAFGRQPDAASALAFAAIALGLIAPGQLLEPGAIYSFLVVAGIMVLYPALHTLIRAPSYADPLAREQMQPGRHRLDRMLALGVDVVRVSVAAWLVSLPLTAHYFGQISLIALLANVLVIPLTGLVLSSAVLSLVAVLISESLAVTLNHATVGLTAVLITLSRWFAALPYASVAVDPWSWPMVWGWLMLLVIVAAAVPRRDGSEAPFHASGEAS